MTIIGSSYSSQIAASSSYTAASKTSKTSSSQSSSSSNDVIAAFLKYQQMTPEQKLREAILKKLGYTEEQLDSMTPDARAAAEEKIKEAMKEMIEQGLAEKGILVDLSV